MGNISYSVTDVCYNFYRSSSPFNATSAYYTGNEKEQSFIAFIKQEITSHEMKVSTRKNHESTINLLRRFRSQKRHDYNAQTSIINLSAILRRTWNLWHTTKTPLPNT